MAARRAGPGVPCQEREVSNQLPPRITRHPPIHATPTWSPAGNQIAFTSDRSGSPQIYIVDADGLDQPRRITSNESWADRATWSPAQVDARTSSLPPLKRIIGCEALPPAQRKARAMTG